MPRTPRAPRAIAAARRTLGENHASTVAFIVSLAQVMAFVGAQQEALDLLREAVDHGYRDADQVASNEDFASLRADQRFQTLITEIRKTGKKQ